ncbi:MAG TPA: hypothetical protein VN026_10910 [Bacteroidia bacterium]|jgi:hypothetical protein|nr:hypothetical protein [Bacteroidia bacterium]
MRKILCILFFPIYLFSGNLDSLHFSIFGGITINNYFSKDGLAISSSPFGFRGGIGIIRDMKSDFVFCSNIWYQNSQYNDINTYIYDKYYSEQVRLNTNLKISRLYWSAEVTKKLKKFYLGINTGVSYTLKSDVQQFVYSNSTNANTNINLFNKYIVYSIVGKNLNPVLNPFVGVSISYYPTKRFGIKYENNIDILASPYRQFAFIKPFHLFQNSITLTLKIK